MMDTKNYSDISTWTIEDLIDSLSEKPIKKEKVIIPKYQRNLVWSSKQKKSFIDSIKSGFPFSSLLLFKEGSNKDGITQYSLVDGLQRTTTIMRYIEKPTEFFEYDNIEENLVVDILKMLKVSEEQREELLKCITNLVKSLKGFKESDGYSSYKLGNKICSHFNINPYEINFDMLIEIIVPFKEKIEKESDISKIKIPVIIYTGEESNLPTIFERINSKGTKLNKYQIYAATWSRSNMKINNTEIINHIKAKYDSLIEEGLQVDNYDPNSKEFYKSNFNVFEYVFGLGKYLSNTFPHLFGEYNNEDNTESIGFNLCTMCLLNDLNNMTNLPNSILRLNQEKFLNALLDSINIVYTKLKPFITLKANKKKSKNTSRAIIYHTEYQIVSFIAKIFKSKYDDNLNERDTWKIESKQILKNIPYHYLYDILREYWRGSGDSKLKELVKKDSRYEKNIYKENWDNILDEWFSYQLERKEKIRVSIKDVDILFLKYIYAHILTSYQETSNIEFEIEHLVPVARLKFIANENGVPISAVSNLCLISKEINRDKRDLTIYEYFDEKVNNEELTKEQACNEVNIIEQFTFTKREDLSSVNNMTREHYILFLKDRFNKLKKIFYEKNDIISEFSVK